MARNIDFDFFEFERTMADSAAKFKDLTIPVLTQKSPWQYQRDAK